MDIDAGTIAFGIALVIFISLVLGGRRRRAKPPAPPALPPEDPRTQAVRELEQRAEAMRRKRAAMGAAIEDDPEGAARTLRQFMKKK